MKTINGHTLVKRFEDFAPPSLAADRDPIGLHFGSLDHPIERVFVTLDVRPETVREAIDKGCDFIFAHHPPIFRAIRSFDMNNPQNRMYADIIKHDLTVYAAHTNLDAAQGGMNHWLADALQLKDTEVMDVHQQIDGVDYGYGRVGNLDDSMPFEDFVRKVKATFAVDSLRYVGHDLEKNISRVAIMGGSGGSFYQSALEKRADVYITGDISYHVGHDIEVCGLLAIDPGHHIESICIDHLTRLFRTWAQEEDWALELVPSELNTDPFYFA